jgi:fibronectin-binding autotransporter adhesin
LNYAGKFDAAVPHDGSTAPSHTYFHVDHPPAHAPADAIVVPDAHFLFHADFKRSGVDLILSGDDREVVLHDYFKGEKRAALASPDGAHLTGDIVNALTGHVDVAQAGTNPAAGQVIGHVTKLQGNATAIRNGVSIILNNGDNVEKGDVLQSGSDSTLGITFVDGTVFGLSSNARMVLNEMVYDPNGSNNSSLMSLVAGTISFVAGQTAKHGDMKIDTPVATMGIRGTAVLVQIDFSIPGQSGAPNASFQVLVEPDGTTGSYILFDKTTLQPIAMVNQAGQQININNGVISQSNAPLPPDVQKLIQDVFTQKFTDNSNTKQTSPSNDSVTPPQQQPFIKLADGATATPFVLLVTGSDSLPTISNGPAPSIQHIPGPPTAVVLNPLGQVTTGFSIAELAGTTGGGILDAAHGVVNFVDVNAGDQPTVKVDFSSFVYQSAKQQNVTGTLSALQLADIAATEIKIGVVADPNNKNNGSANWTYSVADKAFDFLAAGEQLTLTYLVRVDNNYAPNNESTTIPITITITGTNDVPVITTSAQTIAFSGGTSVPGGTLTTDDTTSGDLSFQDADLTDTHTVATKLTSAVLSSGSTVPPGPLALFEKALTASILADSTGTGFGTIHWQLADLPVYLADFVPKDQTLTLTYTVTVTDSTGATTSQTVTVSVTGTDNPAVVWIATTAPGSAAGGFWSEKGNWETGTVPTATDDVIIITNQLIGLTPSFPVTIDAETEAFAKSVSMNDFRTSDSDGSLPELINLGSLSIGSGGLSLNADSFLRNSGTITVTGATEIDGTSVLQNSGTFVLGDGGKFVDQSHITNTSTGTIEVAGGALNVLVDIANAGKIVVDSGATLALQGGAIDGGTISISGTLELEGLGVLKNGSLGNTGHIDITGSGNAIDNEDVTNAGALEILAAGALLIDLGSSVANKGGTITVDETAALTVNDATITNGTITNKSGGTIDLTGSATLTGGALKNSGQVNLIGSNVLEGETVTNTSTGAVSVTGVLLLELGASIIGGKLSNSGTVQIETSAGATLDGVTVDNTSGTIAVDTDQSPPAKLTLDDGTTITKGTLTIGIAGTLEVSTGFGATLSGVSVDSSGKIQVDGGSALTLESTTIAGGLLSNRGTVHIETAAGATFDGVNVDNAYGTIQVDTDQSPPAKLIVDDGTTISNGTLAVGINGTLEVSSNVGATLSGVDIENSGLVEIDAGSVLALSGTTITGGAVSIDGTLNATGTSSIINANISISDTGLVESTSGVLTIDPDAAVGITNHGTLEANGGELDIVGEPVTNTGTLQAIDDSILKLLSLTVTNDNGHVSVELQSTLDLVDAIIKGGTIDVAGTLDATGNSAIEGAHIVNSGVLEVTGGTLTIDAASDLDNTGIVEANGGKLIINGALSGNAEIAGASVLELGANSLDAYKDADITFTDGSTGTLKIDHSETFMGEIAGLDDNTLDLGDIAFGAHTKVSFAGDSNGGTLTIVNTDDPTQVAHIHLDGDYLGSSWGLSSDGSGGTDITEVPGVLSGLDSHGNAVEGATIKASITDGGHEVTNANYTFETSSDGTTWTVVQSGPGDSYKPTEADEGLKLKVLLSYTDSDGNGETSSVSAGTVQEGPNHPPVILSETDPVTQTIILAESPIVLPPGTVTNSLGLHTETFDVGVDAGAASNNGHGYGNFTSSELNAVFTASGNAGVVSGSSPSVSAAPFIGPLPGHQDTSHYLSVGANGAETISFETEQNAFGLYWGSVDSFNKIAFYNGDKLIASYTGADVSPLLANGDQSAFSASGYVEFADLAPFNKVVLTSGNSNAFEVDNISAGYKSDHHIHLTEPITGTLTVSDQDVGNNLTASVTGPADIKYNGSSTLPSGVNFDALINPSAVTFDSVKADGKADVMHWSYNPTDPDLDFLEPGDTLTITFHAQVNDGHATAGNQALTITLTGTGSSVVNGTAQNDVFDHVGGGVTIFGHGGNDTFAFNANFGSATIGDFDLNHDTINFDHAVFDSVQSFLAGAQSANSGHDTIITDANHDKIVLTGVNVNDLKAHPGDFHLV